MIRPIYSLGLVAVLLCGIADSCHADPITITPDFSSVTSPTDRDLIFTASPSPPTTSITTALVVPYLDYQIDLLNFGGTDFMTGGVDIPVNLNLTDAAAGDLGTIDLTGVGIGNFFPATSQLSLDTQIQMPPEFVAPNGTRTPFVLNPAGDRYTFPLQVGNTTYNLILRTNNDVAAPPLDLDEFDILLVPRLDATAVVPEPTSIALFCIATSTAIGFALRRCRKVLN